jgi:hypothetical protein
MRQLLDYRYFLFLVLLLSACVTLQQTTLQEKLGYSYGALAAARNTAASLLERGRISTADAKQVQAQSDGIRVNLDTAKSLLRADKPNDASTWLELANTQLRGLENYLKSKEATK